MEWLKIKAFQTTMVLFNLQKLNYWSANGGGPYTEDEATNTNTQPGNQKGGFGVQDDLQAPLLEDMKTPVFIRSFLQYYWPHMHPACMNCKDRRILNSVATFQGLCLFKKKFF